MEKDRIIKISTEIVNARFEGYLNPSFPCDDCKFQKLVGAIKRCSKGKEPLRAAHLRDCVYHVEKDMSVDDLIL